MEIYIIALRTNTGPNACDVELDYIHCASTKENAIRFIKKAIEDKYSGIKENALIDITCEIVDQYFGNFKLETKRARDWVYEISI
jgi:hypothetical protein